MFDTKENMLNFPEDEWATLISDVKVFYRIK